MQFLPLLISLFFFFNCYNVKPAKLRLEQPSRSMSVSPGYIGKVFLSNLPEQHILHTKGCFSSGFTANWQPCASKLGRKDSH